MEDHPIPQDITGFQFKLIGKLTVKQFGYVAAGVILAWLIYFVLKIPGIIGIPLSLAFIIIGLALAFFPVDGRPLDVMLGNFIRALFAPTQYVYGKQGGGTNSTIQASQPAHPVGIQAQSLTPQIAQSSPTPNVFPAPSPISLGGQVKTEAPTEPQIETEEKQEELKIQTLEAQVKESEKENDGEKTLQLQKALDDSIKQKESLEKELLELKTKLETMNKPPAQAVPVQSPEPLPVPPPPPVVASPDPIAQLSEPVLPPTPVQAFKPADVPQQPSLSPAPNPIAPLQPMPPTTPSNPAPTPLPAAPMPNTLDREPNLITGIVRDPRGNALQNILVEVKDQEDNPVRAFKTNRLGEFASATSLANGQYTVLPEDPKLVHKFDTTSVLATGNPIPPLEITSIDPREELRRELFN